MGRTRSCMLVGRTPWSARDPLDPLPQALTNASSRPTGASAADQGVRPTLHSPINSQDRPNETPALRAC